MIDVGLDVLLHTKMLNIIAEVGVNNLNLVMWNYLGDSKVCRLTVLAAGMVNNIKCFSHR